MPRRKVTPELMERMRELRAKGWPYQRIAAELGLSVMTVYNHLKKAEVGEPRGGGGPGEERGGKEGEEGPPRQAIRQVTFSAYFRPPK